MLLPFLLEKVRYTLRFAWHLLTRPVPQIILQWSISGVTRSRASGSIIRLLKIAGVWTFATQSLWGINLAFGFFVSLITNGVWWVTSSIMPAAIGNIGDSVMPVYAFFDNLIYTTVTGPVTDGGAKLIGFFGVMLNVLPTPRMVSGKGVLAGAAADAEAVEKLRKLMFATEVPQSKEWMLFDTPAQAQ